ncbi:MAG: hypothetical protein IT428_15445 [Planctomycetaceae bacterium]|nr:hypothetical protein [Planctomycetaceae bacterium]
MNAVAPLCQRRISALLAAVLLVAVAVGCKVERTGTGGTEVGNEPEHHVPVFRKTTQDIAKFDPAAGRKVSDSKVNATDPVFGPLQAVGPIIEQVSKVTIAGAVNNFYALEGRWPNYDEFMTQIIKQNNIQLPVLPARMEYQYDEARHELVVVAPLEDDKKPASAPAGEAK